MNKLQNDLDNLDRELQDLKERLYCRPACIYHAYRNHTVLLSISKLKAMPSSSQNQERIDQLLKEFYAKGSA